MDELVREDMNVSDEAYSDIRFEMVEAFRYMKYAVISTEPEDDALNHVRVWAKELNKQNPEIIGWDFPLLSQEQINVLNMHGCEVAPFRLIPNAYKVLMTHMKINGINHKEDKKIISCFEEEYDVEGVHYMDVYIAVE